MRRWAQFILCLLLSAGIWLIHNLSQNFVSIVSVPFVAESNIDGRARMSSVDATVTAQVRASGFRHANLLHGRSRPRVVQISAEDFQHVGGDVFTLGSSEIYKYATAIFGEGVTVESVLSQSPNFVFAEVTNKKVPVRRVLSLSYAPQYMALSPMVMFPDSVTVYGEASRLENVNYVLTYPMELRNLSSSANGRVKLDVPAGVSLSQDEVVYSLDVTRYVEVKAEVELQTRNVPAGSELKVLPSSAAVVFKCIFPTATDPMETASFYVDYEDFVGSLTGRCVAHADKLPANVLGYILSPEVFDCILLESD